MNDEIKEVLLDAAKAGGAVIEQYFRGAYKIENKTTINDLVTEVDKHAEHAIIEVIKDEFRRIVSSVRR